MKLVLLGPPGAGKGTQAANLCERYGIPAISTGNMIRAAIAAGTPMGLAAKAVIDRGGLVADDVVVGIVKERLAQPDCEAGFVLDGFPRTIPQAEALEALGVELDAVVELELADETIIQRMSGRRVCPDCGASYHLTYQPPKAEGVCDECGAALSCRADDMPETVAERLRVYHSQTAPLSAFYRERGLLRTVQGQEQVADTTALMMKAVEDLA